MCKQECSSNLPERIEKAPTNQGQTPDGRFFLWPGMSRLLSRVSLSHLEALRTVSAVVGTQLRKHLQHTV